MADQRLMTEHARNYLSTQPDAGEGELRTRLRQRFLIDDDQGLAEGAARVAGQGPSGEGLLITLLLLPVVAYRWLFFRKRLSGLEAQIDQVVESLRREGLLTLPGGPAEPGAAPDTGRS